MVLWRVLGVFFQGVNLDLVDVGPLGVVGSDPDEVSGAAFIVCVIG
jgi:hypothetical protein